MPEYGPETFGDRWADIYDEWVATEAAPRLADPEQVADVLANLAGSGPALELAIGTGRIALPLAARGVEVHGIDVSEKMVEKLRAKPGGDRIPVTFGDFADLAAPGRYRLIYIVFNTFFALLTQEEQVRCFGNVASRLTDDGVFALEAFVPDVTRYVRGQNVEANAVDVDRVRLDVAMHDPKEQRIRAMQVVIAGGRLELFPVQLRYAWPSELDLMARLAGLRLRDRWGGWDGDPFTSSSGSHVSIYEHAPSG
jgi:Methyltransferase domain